MPRNETESRRNPRRNAEREAAAQPMGGQPRSDDGEDALEKPEEVPSFLTARELQAREPASGGEELGEDGEDVEAGDEPTARPSDNRQRKSSGRKPK